MKDRNMMLAWKWAEGFGVKGDFNRAIETSFLVIQRPWKQFLSCNGLCVFTLSKWTFSQNVFQSILVLL